MSATGRIEESRISPITRFIYTALVVVQAGILITGGAVRLTGSGLGCPTWPQCTPGSYTPVPHQAQGTLHSWIEFGNRLLTVLLFIAIIAAIVGVLRLRNRPEYSQTRRAIKWLALTQFLGIVAQIVLGGITVLTHLNPATVGAHFLLSIVLIGASLSLRQRMVLKRRVTLSSTSTLLVRTVLGLTAVVLLIGTIVTGTGPHAGDIQARRYHLDPRVISWIHADAVIALIALTFALILLMRATEDLAHRSLVVKEATIFFFICLGQGLIGYIQYFTGLPEALVAAHLLGADLVWLGIWNLTFTGRALSRK
jgi:cytochrome c oxidase assembly protein subunit 15